MTVRTNVFSLKLVNRASRKTMHLALQSPVRVRLAPEVAGTLALWMCHYEVRRGRKTVCKSAYGGSWPDALLRAGEGLRCMIPEGETRDWVTEEGVESWRVFPRVIEPVAGSDAEAAPAAQDHAIHYMVTLRNRKRRRSLDLTMTMPEPVAQPAWMNTDRPTFRCTVTVRKRRKEVTRHIHGSHWTDAITNGFEYMRSLIPDEEEGDWETADGLPSWCLFPKIVPISWGRDFHRKVWDLVKAEDNKFQAEIERRRALRDGQGRHE